MNEVMRVQYQSVIFVDLDNTVMEGPFESIVFPTVCGELAKKSGRPPQEIRRLIDSENSDRRYNPNVSATLAMDWDDIVSTVAERLGVTLEANVLEIVESHAGPPYSRLLDDADQVLQLLSSSHRAIVVATLGLRKYQVPVLNALNLTPLFDNILTPDSNNALKQDLIFYGQWPKLTRLQIMVGDNYDYDIRAPHRFGFKTVWKPNGQYSEVQLKELRSLEPGCPDVTIHSLHELPDVVAQLENLGLSDCQLSSWTEFTPRQQPSWLVDECSVS